MTKVLELGADDNPVQNLQTAAQELQRGELVILPTDCGYVAAADPRQLDALRKLAHLGREGDKAQYHLALKSLDEALDYAPDLSSIGQKLGRRCWPGPVVLAVDVPGEKSLLHHWPEAARTLILRENELALRVVAHEAVQSILRLLPAPLVLLAEFSGTTGGTISLEELLRKAGPQVAWALDAGPARYHQPPTVVRLTGNAWQVQSEGIVSERMLTRLAGEMFLFVCTGNTCRSPMAEGMFRKLAADRLHCAEEELMDRGLVVVSAGLAAAPGAPASPESVQILQERGIDLQGHASQPLTPRLLRQADRIYTMTRSHRDAILDSVPEVEDRVEVLARDGTDICDPIGYGLDQYQKCAADIERHLTTILDDLHLPA